MQKICDCKKFKKNNEEFKSIFILAWSHEMEYKGDIFNFCPWCGKKLVIEQELGD